MFCEICGKQIEKGIKFCPNCGASVKSANIMEDNAAEKIDREGQNADAPEETPGKFHWYEGVMFLTWPGIIIGLIFGGHIIIATLIIDGLLLAICLWGLVSSFIDGSYAEKFKKTNVIDDTPFERKVKGAILAIIGVVIIIIAANWGSIGEALYEWLRDVGIDIE